jgi:hypothetical protein
MKKNIIYIAMCIFTLFACQETQQPSSFSTRYIYYSTEGLNSGLFKYNLSNRTVESLYDYSIQYLSNSSINNIMFFECYCSKSYIRVKGSSGNSFILPEFLPSDTNIIFLKETEIAPVLDYSGNNIFYLQKQVKIENIPAIADTTQFLLDYNFLQEHHTIIQLRKFALEQFPQSNHFRIAGNSLITSKSGNRLFMVIKGYLIHADVPEELGYLICEYNGVELLKRSVILSKEPILLSFDDISDILIYHYSGDIYRLGDNNKIEILQTGFKQNLSTKQFAFDKQELVMWNDKGIGIYNSNNFSFISQVILFDDIVSKYGNYKTTSLRNELLTISPDAEEIVFALEKSNGMNDLYSVKRNGTSLLRVLENKSVQFIAVSPEYN